MGKLSLTKSEIDQIKNLRETGHSLGEIKTALKRGYGTIYRYIKDISILPEYQDAWRIKRGASKARSIRNWQKAELEVEELFKGDISFREKLLILSSLYWGEGNKTELNLINGDPTLVRVFISCLKELGVTAERLKISVRLFEEIDIKEAVDFWIKTLDLPRNSVISINVIKGKKKGKLKYGMCRIRVEKGGQYFKMIMSMVSLIRTRI